LWWNGDSYHVTGLYRHLLTHRRASSPHWVGQELERPRITDEISWYGKQSGGVAGGEPETNSLPPAYRIDHHVGKALVFHLQLGRGVGIGGSLWSTTPAASQEKEGQQVKDSDQGTHTHPREMAARPVTVIPYREDLRPAFDQLNRDWIETYFELENADREVLGDPRGKILAPGGQVFFVLEDGEVRGTCAVLRHSRDEYEIAKMAVAPAARGRGFGDLLMETAVAFARDAGALRVVIVSNTVLEPAIRLYRKHGFVQVPLDADGRYRRANIRLERELEPRAPAVHPAGEPG
jgi:putative acetyltransferase